MTSLSSLSRANDHRRATKIVVRKSNRFIPVSDPYDFWSVQFSIESTRRSEQKIFCRFRFSIAYRRQKYRSHAYRYLLRSYIAETFRVRGREGFRERRIACVKFAPDKFFIQNQTRARPRTNKVWLLWVRSIRCRRPGRTVFVAVYSITFALAAAPPSLPPWTNTTNDATRGLGGYRRWAGRGGIRALNFRIVYELEDKHINRNAKINRPRDGGLWISRRRFVDKKRKIHL